ncbi:MAG: cytidine deaminase [Ignavibacteriae bacterium]|nr:cytidine deaminase [Ignavibacteriota bacterium]
MKYHNLVKAARKAIKFSYSPYSRFRVGAAVLTASGKIYTGCNIENSSFSLTICAERTALFKAVSERHRKFRAIAIVSDNKEFTPPCGACRQVMLELAGDIDVILSNANGNTKIVKLNTLLPIPFDAKTLKH